MVGLFTMLEWPEPLDWPTKSIVMILAIRSVKNGTWPNLKRSDCGVAGLSRESGLTVERVRRCFLAAVDSGALKVSEDRSSVAIVSRGVNVAEVGGDSESTLGEKPTAAPTPKKKPRKRRVGRPASATLEEAAIFSAWRSGMGKNAATKLSERRLLALRKAMMPESKHGLGFTAEEVLRSIQGWVEYCKEDQWRLERLSRHELCLLLRDVEHIEQGLEMFDRANNHVSESELAILESMKRGAELRG